MSITSTSTGQCGVDSVIRPLNSRDMQSQLNLQNGKHMQTRNEKIAAKTQVLQDILDDFTDCEWIDSLSVQQRLIAAGYLIVEL